MKNLLSFVASTAVDLAKGNHVPTITRESVRRYIGGESVSDELIDHAIDILFAIDSSLDVERHTMSNLRYNEVTGEFEEA